MLTIRPKKIKNQTRISEREIQIQVESYLDRLGIMYVRIPDSLWSFVNTKGSMVLKVQCSKFLAGAPDLMIFGVSKDGEAKTLLIELKDAKGKLLPSQEKWHKGTKVHVCRSFDESRALIDEWRDK